MKWHIFRIGEGDHAGLVDYLGDMEGESSTEVEYQARLLFDWSPGIERIEVEKASVTA